MGVKGAVGVLYGKKLLALPESERAAAEGRWQKEYEKKQLNFHQAVRLGYAEGPVALRDLRRRLFLTLKKMLGISENCV